MTVFFVTKNSDAKKLRSNIDLSFFIVIITFLCEPKDYSKFTTLTLSNSLHPLFPSISFRLFILTPYNPYADKEYSYLL
ncbi:hypothetical protein GCM10022297_04560 [Lactobacillus hamsteri]